MSTYDTEFGTIKLPSAEFAKVRKAVEQQEKRLKEYGLALAKHIWQNMPAGAKKDRDTYWQEHIRLGPQSDDPNPDFATRYISMPEPLQGQGLDKREIDHIVRISKGVASTSIRQNGKPARPQRQFIDFPTNRSTSFDLDGAIIEFDKKTNSVSWEVFENNNGVARVHKHPVFNALIDSLDEVKWTRGTGGSSEHQWEHDGYGSATNFAFGPNGAVSNPRVCHPYTMSDGKRVTRQDLNSIAEDQFKARTKASRAVAKTSARTANGGGPQPRGHKGHAGQYTYRTAGASDVWL